MSMSNSCVLNTERLFMLKVAVFPSGANYLPEWEHTGAHYIISVLASFHISVYAKDVL